MRCYRDAIPVYRNSGEYGMIRYIIEYREEGKSYVVRARYNFRTRETLYTLGYSCNIDKLDTLDPYDPPALFSKVRDADEMVALLTGTNYDLNGNFYVLTRNL